jgi:prepilin-type N-terminal cleavage/methylation domain-containing protein
MSTPSRIPASDGRRAFTLIEMIIVISIISVLLGLLYGSLERARKFSRRAIAFSEVKNIEAGLKQYYAHYHDWPPDTFYDSLSQKPLTSGGDGGFVIDANAALMLQGSITDNSPQGLRDANPDRLPFVEFARFSTEAQGQSVPINPFRITTATALSRQYKVLFDLDGDSKIFVRDPSISSFSTNVFKSLVVWTLIPGTPGTGRNDGSESTRDEVIGSWDTFEAK